ncbi:LemA family protein [Hydrogenimonas sp.]
MEFFKKAVAVVAALALLAVVLAAPMAYYHNKAVTLDEKVQAAWSQVLNQYKRRADLIPNLVRTVKGYASHEKETLEAVVKARALATGAAPSPRLLDDPKAFEAFNRNQEALGAALSRLLLVVERYPQLKADRNFLALQAQLEGTENRIAVARRDYIEAVRAYNTTLRSFPASLFLSVTDPELKPRPAFTISKAQRETPRVEF